MRGESAEVGKVVLGTVCKGGFPYWLRLNRDFKGGFVAGRRRSIMGSEWSHQWKCREPRMCLMRPCSLKSGQRGAGGGREEDDRSDLIGTWRLW